MTPRLHVLGIPHAVTHGRFSHDAICGKVLRFAPMLRSVGDEVVHYGIEGAESGANEQVDVLSHDTWLSLGGREPSTRHANDLCDVGTPLYRAFNAALVPLLRDRLEPRDLLCLPFGIAHDAAIAAFPEYQRVETGIGYPWPRAREPHAFRIYESHAWMHYCTGREGAGGSDYDFVIPNSYDPGDWRLGGGEGGYLLYFGRIMADKGLPIVVEIAAARRDLQVILCGLGDPTPWLTLPNIEYRPPIHGEGRDALLGNALAVLMPTRYVEPFGSVGVEAMLCGTPVLASSFGAFAETVRPFENGLHCRTLGDWLEGIEMIEHGGYLHNRDRIQAETQSRYSMWNRAHDYHRAFQQITDLHQAGWYSRRPSLAEESCA